MRERRSENGKSTAGLAARVRSARGQVRLAAVLLALIPAVVAYMSAAWFASNDRVSGDGASVAVRSDEKYIIASAGGRLTDEINYLRDENGNGLVTGDGMAFNSYRDCGADYAEVTQGLTLYPGTAWRLTEESGAKDMQPGSHGTLELYIIPRVEGLTALTVRLDTAAYQLTADGTAARRVEDETLARLVDGHLLFFRGYDSAEGYSGWLGEERTFTLTAPEDGAFEKDAAYKVTLHWAWATYLRYYVETGHEKGNLCSAGKDSDKLAAFVEEQANFESSKLFYRDSSVAAEPEKPVKEHLAAWTEYYDKADQYIGKNAGFIYVETAIE